MLTVKVDADGLIRSLTNLQQKFAEESYDAVARTAQELTSDIIVKTLGPAPPPLPTKYKRTHQFVRGWAAAADLFGLYMPTLRPRRIGDYAITPDGVGTALLGSNESGAYFRAENKVPYAYEIEHLGTWKNAELEFRGGYDIVGSTMREMKSENKFPKYVREAWTLAKNAA